MLSSLRSSLFSSVWAQDGGRLQEGVARADAAVGPDVEHQLVVVGVLADAGVFDGVLDAGDRAVDRVDRDDADGGVGALVFLPGGETAADADFKFALELGLAVKRADDLVLVDDLVVIVFLDVAGGDDAFLVGADGEQARLLAFAVVAEAHLLQVEHDLDDIFEDAGDGAELVLNAADLHGGDGGALQRGEQDAAQGVADRVTVTLVEGFGDELRVGVGGGGLVANEAIRHFESG
jgi:hypothetical protein